MTKPCTVCGGARDNGTSQCRVCRAAAMRAYRATEEGKAATRRAEANRPNKEDRKVKGNPIRAAYMKSEIGREKAKKALAKYRARHKEKLYAKERERRAKDPLFRLRANLRRMVRFALARRGYKKGTKTFEALGCDFDTLKTHIERHFHEGMSWENYGEWEIDHYIPISLGNTEQEILALSRFTNLRPLWSQLNKQKQNKLPEDYLSVRLASGCHTPPLT